MTPGSFSGVTRPQIPANGSELFDESDSEEENYNEEVYEPRKPVYSHRNAESLDEAAAEERYRQREARLRKNAETRRKNRHLGGKILAVLQFVLSIIFMGLILKLDVLPTKYFIAASVILIVLAVICFLLQFRKHAHWVGKDHIDYRYIDYDLWQCLCGKDHVYSGQCDKGKDLSDR